MSTAMAVQDNNRAIQTVNDEPLTVDGLLSHVRIVDQVKKAVMRDGTHYGTIPGCGDKPTLLQPGAQKLALAFRLTSYVAANCETHDGEHLECVITVGIRTMRGVELSQCIGSCSTKENKYRYRWENTGKSVPQEYWNTRDSSLIGGPSFSTRKIKGSWFIFHRVEHDNPADYYNTVRKMAFKRAYVGAVISATTASDQFTQDVEDMGGVIDGDASPPPSQQRTRQQQANTSKPPESKPVEKAHPAPPESATWSHFQLDPDSQQWPEYFRYVIHWSKNRGLMLGEISFKSFEWYRTEWTPKDDSPTASKDAAMKSAIQQCHEHGL